MSKNIHQLIEEKNPERKEALRQNIKERLDFPKETEQEHSKPTLSIFKKRVRIFASISSALVVACLAIILPIVLKRDTRPTERYCYAADCVEKVVDYTLKDYSERNNLSLLYIDWYDIADEIQTKVFVSMNDSSDIIYFRETLVNGETGSVATLYITNLHTTVDRLEDIGVICDKTVIIGNITVHWIFQNDEGVARFEYLGHKYVIDLKYPMAEDSVLELVESMMPKA